MAKPKKVLITGGAGFIGSNLVSRLTEVGYKVVVLDRNGSNISGSENLNKNISELSHSDLESVEVVIHLAWSSVPASKQTMTEELELNIKPSQYLIDTAEESGVEQFVFMSSAGAIYGNSDSVLTESSPTNPVSNYGKSKLAVEEYLQANSAKMSWVILRPSNVYGSGQKLKRGQGLIPAIIEALETGSQFTLRGNARKDYLHIVDLCSAVEMLISDFLDNQIYNLASGEVYSSKEIINLIQDSLGRKLALKELPIDDHDLESVIVDAVKFRKKYNWKPISRLENYFQKILIDRNKTRH